ncbi:nuclear protein MDM1 isoform X3 [Salvelinus fontinalis]|uniref:nuclear protein MDM1 isoform X3 n=1 Tax=Salvelinus fontinalis TaxID=8038 RepID=UPI002485B6E1|nr:nuclear protein MDM1 isoform X3 [Salvelinus fontinalis]
MPVHFKGISEYKKKFKDRVARSRSASPQRRMRLAGLRSDQMGISREPQFLSKRKVPSSHTPQVSSSFQWNPTTTEPPQRRDETPRPGTSPLAPTPERVHTPLAPRGPPSPGDPQRGPTTLQGQTHTRSPLATVERKDQVFNGVDHVLRRKAGLKSSGQRTALQNSEYRKQFPWKTPVAGHASPLLAAEQMLYTSHRSIPPFKSNPVVVLESEYSRNFKASPPPRGPRLRSHGDGDQVPLFQRENVSPEKASKSKRKKKREERERKSSVVAENIPVPQPQEQRADQEVKSQSPQKAHLPHRKVKSEYNANFRSPLNYIYKDGAWVKATTVGEEVRELRKKAEAYRQRAWGTHFSRLHLNQILSDQNQLWEASTPSSSNLSSGTGSGDGEEDGSRSPTPQALELARVDSSSSSVAGPPPLTPVSSRRSSTRGAGDTAGLPGAPNPGAPTLPVQRRLAWEEETGAGGGTGEKREEEEDKERKDELRVLDHRSSSVAGSHSSREGGRMPTPTLQRIATVQRTHHDLTTPATGNLGLRTSELLLCPGGGCGTDDEDDRMSQISSRSAASCSMASQVLDRAQRRKDHFWGKR